jgi:Clp amino terminal domain, pathogenicity island component
MPRELPERPSFDHLKKQAKVLLRDMRLRDPAAKLTTAQHALAREYGFASWRELKAHVETHSAQEMDAPPSAYAFGRYTTKARLALFLSRQEAANAGSAAIDPVHVLLGSIRASTGLRGRIFDRVRVSLERARTEVRGGGDTAEPLPFSVEIPFSGQTKRILLAATAEADRLGHDGIGLAHLLLGMLGVSESPASARLTAWGMSAQRVRDDMAHLLDESESSK